MSLMALENVQKWAEEGKRRIEILRGVSLTVEEGEFLAIMGPSGSGKSTLLNLMGLLDKPNEGSIRWRNKDISRLDEDALADMRSKSIGFIFQLFNLLPYLTVRQNVALPVSYGGKPVDSSRMEGLLARMNMSDRLDAYPPTLSGGEKQRVAIARALANEPSLLLADEPTGALDTQTGDQVMDLISELHGSGVTIVLITHNESVARRARRVCVMRDGRME